MNAIVGFTQLAQKAAVSPYVVECLDKINVSAESLLSLINDILDMSKIEGHQLPLKNSVFNIDNFVKEINESFKHKTKAKSIVFISNTVNITTPFCTGDQSRLKQIITNIISNSVEYTPNFGEIEFTTEQKYVSANTAFFRFTIRDTGIGISKEFLPHLFDPFRQGITSQTNPTSGSGLGLSIVNSLVEMMNGKINVESEINKGTTFTLDLHFRLSDVEQLKIQAENEKDKKLKLYDVEEYPGKRILVVEDSQLNYEILATLLEQKKINVHHALNGQEAVDMFYKNETGFFDLIFMDVMMPVKNGLVATEEIRSSGKADGKSIPIIAITANAFVEDIAKSLASGMNGHISKPFTINLLNKELFKYLK